MKLKYLFSAIIASVLLLVGCEQEPIGTFEDIKLSSTNVSIPAEGGEVSVTLTTTKDWAFVTTDFEWLTLDGPTSGGAGEYVLKFSAEAVSGGRDLTLEIKAGSHSQYITIRQGTKAVENATCADVVAGVDGKVYRVTGVCTKIANDLYGNWYLNDGTGEVYVYGTLDKDGATKNFSSWKMEAGDIVTVEGPRKDYNGTIELVDVTVLNIEKSLLKIEEKPEAIAKEGGEYLLKLSYKGSGVQPSVPAVDEDGNSVDYREWISVVAVETKFGEATKLEPNPADTAFVTIRIQPNDGATRDGRIDFASGTDEASSTVPFEFTQEGAIEEVTIADAIASGELCSVLGKVLYTHSKGLLITDGRDVLYGYLGAAPEVAVDDVVKMVGAVTKYNGGRSMNKPVVAKAEGTVGTYRTPAPVVLDAAKFAEYTSAAADFATPYVMITGKAESDSYGNLIVKLVDGETTYSVKSYYGNDSYADWADKDVKAYGYAYNAYADSKQVNLVAVTVLDADAEEPAGPEISTIASVLALGQDAVIPDGTIVEGIVISNAALSNLTSKKGMYLQDESGAVQLRFSADHTFAFGDKLQLDLSGVKVGAYNQAVQLSVANENAAIVSTGNTVTPKAVTMADFLANKYEGQYVALEGVQVVEADLAKTWGDATNNSHVSINMEDAEGNTFVVFSSKYSTFGATAVGQGSGTIKGISAKNNATIQLIFAQESDFAGLTGARFGQEGGEEPGEKAARNLAFSSATATATLGEAFTAPTLSGETDGVLYTSSNTEVATVDAATGAVTLVAAGETTITAAAEETETLQAGSASYTLTVSEAAVELPAGISAIKDLATAAGASFNVTLNDAVVTYVSGSNAYVQDTEAGILIYKSGHGLIAGDKLSGEVSGTVKLFNNLREITEIDITKASKTQGAAIPVTELTLAELNAEGAYDRYENMRIKISKAEMTGDLEISQNGQTYALYKKNSSVKGFDLYNIVDVIGYPGKFYENVQLNVFEDATVSGATKTVLSGFNNVELAVGDTKANKATASSGASVSYASASESIATVDENGTITGVAVGETTITASVEAYNGYPAATATCTVKVVAAGTEVEKAWTLVTDASTLAVGDKIVIAAKGSNVAISTEQKSNNRGQVAITKSGNTMTFTTAVQEITLEAGTKTGTFAFNVGSSQYLYAASSSSNHLKTGSKNDNASWKIEITSAGVATIKAQGTNTRNWLRHNSQSSLFACYGSGQDDVAIYKYQ